MGHPIAHISIQSSHFFCQYKAHLKRNESRMFSDWYSVHMEDLNVINRDQGNKYFRHCKIPGTNKMLLLGNNNESIYLYI